MHVTFWESVIHYCYALNFMWQYSYTPSYNMIILDTQKSGKIKHDKKCVKQRFIKILIYASHSTVAALHVHIVCYLREWLQGLERLIFCVFGGDLQSFWKHYWFMSLSNDSVCQRPHNSLIASWLTHW